MRSINSGFINRNRIFWMNTKGITHDKVIVNEDLFAVPEHIAAMDEIVINIDHSDRPLVVGVMSSVDENIKKYSTYENDESGNIVWIKEFDKFKFALHFAKLAYTYRNASLGINKENYKVDNEDKTLKK